MLLEPEKASVLVHLVRCRSSSFWFPNDERRQRAVERIANGAEQLRLADGDVPVRLDAGSTGDDDSALDGRDRLIEHLQGRVELGEGAFRAGRQADCMIAADEAAHARLESPGRLFWFPMAFRGQERQ